MKFSVVLIGGRWVIHSGITGSVLSHKGSKELLQVKATALNTSLFHLESESCTETGLHREVSDDQ